ncbi:hypothetical protein EBU60_07295, partial [bacterium]|nr:hypothetical protein [bacterium]
RIDDRVALARVAHARLQLGGGMLVCTPVPAADAVDATVMHAAIERALLSATQQGVSGSIGLGADGDAPDLQLQGCLSVCGDVQSLSGMTGVQGREQMVHVVRCFDPRRVAAYRATGQRVGQRRCEAAVDQHEAHEAVRAGRQQRGGAGDRALVRRRQGVEACIGERTQTGVFPVLVTIGGQG